MEDCDNTQREPSPGDSLNDITTFITSKKPYVNHYCWSSALRHCDTINHSGGQNMCFLSSRHFIVCLTTIWSAETKVTEV